MKKQGEVDNLKVQGLFDERANSLTGINSVLSSNDLPGTTHKNLYRDFLTKRALMRNLTLNKEKKILDYGCGIGRLSVIVSDYVKAVDAVDVSKVMISKAKTINNRSNINYASLDEFQWNDSNYDAIFTCWVLQHISDEKLKTLISNFNHSLKLSGEVIILEQISNQRLMQQDLLKQRSREDYIQAFIEQGLHFKKELKIMRFPSYGMSIWTKYNLSSKWLWIIEKIEKITIKRKPQFAEYYSSIMVFEKK